MQNHSIACLVWDRQGRYLFSADASGVVMCHDCEALTSHQVAALGTEVAQVDVGVLDHELTLLVSTRDRCVRIQRPEVEGGAQLQQVGTKLRDVPLGACFYRPSDDLVARIPGGGGPQPSGGSAATACCVRPGRRLWLADASTGVVRSTLRFSAPFEAAAFATGGTCDAAHAGCRGRVVTLRVLVSCLVACHGRERQVVHVTHEALVRVHPAGCVPASDCEGRWGWR